MKTYIGCIAILALAFSASAAVPPKKMKPANKILVGEGVSFGGVAGSGFTMKDIRRTSTNDGKKVERLVIDVGDMNGGDMRGLPGYYYAELKKNPSRLVIDFAQMPHSNLDQNQIDARLKNSHVVKKTAMTLDPIDNSLSLTLDLKENTRVRVYQVAGQKSTSKVVVDLISE